MPTVRALGVFCEDIREEVNGLHSLMGIFPDNLNISTIPGMMPKMCFYTRIVVDPFVDIEPITVWLSLPNGEQQKVNEIDPGLVAATQKSARDMNMPSGTLISRVVAPHFPVSAYGRMQGLLRIGDQELVCATINLHAPPAPQDMAQAQLKEVSREALQPGSRKLKGKKKRAVGAASKSKPRAK